MPETVIFRDVCKNFRAINALDGISFQAAPGEIIGLLGLNGSGKSTILMLAATALSPDSGSVTLFSDPNFQKKRDYLGRIGVLSDLPAHWEHLTAWDNAFFFARSYGLPEAIAVERLDRLFTRFGLTSRRNDLVATYSYGMKRKLGIIEALVHSPDLVLMDEPSMGLDFSSRMALHACVREIAGNGATVIVATNDVYEARCLGQKVLLIDKGRVAAAGTPEHLIGGLGDVTVIELRLGAPVPLRLLEEISGVRQVHVTEDRPGQTRLRIFTGFTRGEMLSGLIAAIAMKVIEAGGAFQGIDIVEPTLGDVLARISGEGPS